VLISVHKNCKDPPDTNPTIKPTTTPELVAASSVYVVAAANVATDLATLYLGTFLMICNCVVTSSLDKYVLVI
jgi:hypothetical protein